MARILLLLLVASLPLSAAAERVTMWEIEAAGNRIFLLGSIHLLRASDYPLPAPIYTAYDEAEALVMELDLDDIDDRAMQSLVLELGTFRDGETLQSHLGADTWRKVERLATAVDIPLNMLAVSKPWLAAITVELIALTRVGFDSTQGLEAHLVSMARRDGKDVSGLETEREQLELLDGLSAQAQRVMLLETLEDAGELENVLNDVIAAWRNGDVDFIEEQILADLRPHRELYQTIVVRRNANWVRQIEALSGKKDDYLVVVGALHLVGRDGVPMMLERKGFDVRQVGADADPRQED